jgi:hypothetical protein
VGNSRISNLPRPRSFSFFCWHKLNSAAIVPQTSGNPGVNLRRNNQDLVVIKISTNKRLRTGETLIAHQSFDQIEIPYGASDASFVRPASAGRL